MAVISYKCPNCGGELIFDPSRQQYLCEYCISHFTQEELEALQPAKQSEKTVKWSEAPEEKESEEKQAVLYTCPSCGAEIVTEETTAASLCYYCHNPVVLSGRLSGELLPNAVIPFQIDRKTAEEKFMDFVGKKRFVPKAFFQKKQIEKLFGVYFPYWIYDCQVEARLDAGAVRIRKWIAGSTEFTETKNFRIERKGTVTLRDYPKNALKKANRKLAEGVFPYHLTEAKEFHMGYLSGFCAECRDIDSAELKEEVWEEIKEGSSLVMKDTIDGAYTGVSIGSEEHQILKEQWKYVLLPVWTVTYRGKNGKMYYYSMNGQTGKVVGELPIDRKKLFGTGGIAAAAVFILALAGGWIL